MCWSDRGAKSTVPTKGFSLLLSASSLKSCLVNRPSRSCRLLSLRNGKLSDCAAVGAVTTGQDQHRGTDHVTHNFYNLKESSSWSLQPSNYANTSHLMAKPLEYRKRPKIFTTIHIVTRWLRRHEGYPSRLACKTNQSAALERSPP